MTDLSDRQEAASCAYARGHTAAAKRLGYVTACRAAATVEQSADALADVTPFTYENPVYGSSFPDPGAFADGPTDYYAYGTGGRFPVLKSSDLVHWETVGRALSARPSWVVQTGDWHPWAPSVLRTPGACPGTTSPGCYFMYYVGLSGQHTPATHCIGVAWSLTPSGPFTDLGPLQAEDGGTDLAGRPPGCGDAEGYSNIDPAPFVDDDGSAYLYLSTGRRCAQPTTGTCPYEPALSVIPLASTPTKAAASRTVLFEGTPGTWEQEPGSAAAVVENPWMEKRGDAYYLFYSGGSYLAGYGMGYATSAAPTEGFEKSVLNPILAETDDVLSPGGGSVTTGPGGERWVVYHGRAGDYSQPRTMRIDPVYWSGTSVSTPGPTTGPQTFPPAPPSPTPGDGGDPPPSDLGGSFEPPPAQAPAAPAELGAPADVLAPDFALGGRRLQRTRRALVVVVGRPSETAWFVVSGRVRIGRSHKAYTLKRVRAFMAAGATRAFRPALSARALRAIRRALRRARVVRATITVAARDAAGNASVKRLTVRLVR